MLQNNEMRVLLLHSNDIHSRLEAASRIAAVIREARSQHGEDHVLVLDIGDHMDRMRLETEGSDGLVNIELLNDAGYDAITLGNNEGLTYSEAQLSTAYAQRTTYDVVVANMLEAQTGQRPEWMKPYTIKERGGLRFGIIGATAAFSAAYSELGWTMLEPLAAIADCVKELRSQVDVVIVMSHLGIRMDQAMADQMDGIDIILGSHTHHLLMQPEWINGTAICAAGRYGEYYGRVAIGWDEQEGRPIIYGESINNGPEKVHDPAADQILARYLVSGTEKLSLEVAHIPEDLPLDTATESPLANLLASGLRSWCKAEIGLVNAGQLLHGLKRGRVTIGQLHQLCPSPINPCLMELSGRDLRLALEQSLLSEFIHKRIIGFGFRGEVLGRLATAGLEVEYDPSAPEMQRIQAIRVAGEAWDDSRIYKVGTIDMFTFKVGYETLASSANVKLFMPEFLRDVIASQLRQPVELERCFHPSWRRI